MSWLPVLGTLLGAVIGATASLTTQRFNLRAADKHEQALRRYEQRGERKAEINAYLKEYQTIERMAGERDLFEYPAKSQAAHDLWAQYNRSWLICSNHLRGALDELTDTITDALWNGTQDDTPIWEYIKEPKMAFLDLAHREVE